MIQVAGLSLSRGIACVARYQLQFVNVRVREHDSNQPSRTFTSWSVQMRRFCYSLLAVTLLACSRNEPAPAPAPQPRPQGGTPPTAAADRPAGTPQDTA